MADETAANPADAATTTTFSDSSASSDSASSNAVSDSASALSSGSDISEVYDGDASVANAQEPEQPHGVNLDADHTSLLARDASDVSGPELSSSSSYYVGSESEEVFQKLEENHELGLHYLSQLNRLERSKWYLRWAALDRLPHRLLYFLTSLRWLRGYGVAPNHASSIKREYFREAFIEGFFFVWGTLFKIALSILVFVQVTSTHSVAEAFDIFLGGNKRTLTVALYQAADSESFRNSMYGIFAIPFIWGFIRAITACNKVQTNPYELSALTDAIAALEIEVLSRVKGRKSWEYIWYDGLRWLFPMYSLNTNLTTVSRALRWDGRLKAHVRQRAHHTLFSLFECSGGLTKFAAARTLARMTNSINRERADEKLAYECNDWFVPLVEPENQSSDISMSSSWSGIPMMALSTSSSDADLSSLPTEDSAVLESNTKSALGQQLKVETLGGIARLATWPSAKWKDAGCGEKLGILSQFLHARYLLWWFGLTRNKKELVAWWIFKLAKLAYTLLFFVTLYRAIQGYLDCPNQKGYTFTGVAPYVGKFDYECLTATISRFNYFPGQEAQTLLKMLPSFYIAKSIKRSFHLDLSRTKITGYSAT